MPRLKFCIYYLWDFRTPLRSTFFFVIIAYLYRFFLQAYAFVFLVFLVFVSFLNFSIFFYFFYFFLFLAFFFFLTNHILLHTLEI